MKKPQKYIETSKAYSSGATCVCVNDEKNVQWFTSVSPVLPDESITLLMLTFVDWLAVRYFRL